MKCTHAAVLAQIVRNLSRKKQFWAIVSFFIQPQSKTISNLPCLQFFWPFYLLLHLFSPGLCGLKLIQKIKSWHTTNYTSVCSEVIFRPSEESARVTLTTNTKDHSWESHDTPWSTGECTCHIMQTTKSVTGISRGLLLFYLEKAEENLFGVRGKLKGKCNKSV